MCRGLFVLVVCFSSCFVWGVYGEDASLYLSEATGIEAFDDQADPVSDWVQAPNSDPIEVAVNDSETTAVEEMVAEDFTSKFARPVTNLNFNHPFIWNEFRPVFIHQEFPDDSALAGGNARIYAAQIWLKLTDRLQLIADKDGYVDFNP
jgi:hypothetical protein